MLPDHFHANLLSQAFPETHTYKVALYETNQNIDRYTSSGECSGHGYEAKTLHGYELLDFGTHARIKFDTTIDWFDADIKTQSAVIFDADTGLVLNIMNFERPAGVIGGVFTLTLHSEGVVQLGEEA